MRQQHLRPTKFKTDAWRSLVIETYAIHVLVPTPPELAIIPVRFHRAQNALPRRYVPRLQQVVVARMSCADRAPTDLQTPAVLILLT